MLVHANYKERLRALISRANSSLIRLGAGAAASSIRPVIEGRLIRPLRRNSICDVVWQKGIQKSREDSIGVVCSLYLL